MNGFDSHSSCLEGELLSLLLSPTNLCDSSAIGGQVASMSSDVLLSAQSDNSELDASDPDVLVSGGKDNLDESTVLPSGASLKTCAGYIVLCCTSDSVWPAESLLMATPCKSKNIKTHLYKVGGCIYILMNAVHVYLIMVSLNLQRLHTIPEQQHHAFPQCSPGILGYFDGTATAAALYAPMETIDVDVYFGNSATQTYNFVDL